MRSKMRLDGRMVSSTCASRHLEISSLGSCGGVIESVQTAFITYLLTNGGFTKTNHQSKKMIF